MAFCTSPNVQRICRILLYAVNGFFILLALLVIGVGLYLLLYKADLLAVVFEMAYIEGSVIVIIFCGAALMLLAAFGLVANRLANFRLLAAYGILLLIVALLLIAAGVIGIVFKSAYYIDEVRQSMRDRIQLNYGIDLNSSYNVHITRTWDTVQEWWYCCAVEDRSWGIYRQSEWYNRQPGDPGVKEYTAKMVPVSCCTKSQYGIYIDIHKCQNWQLGPPNVQTSQHKDINEALHYDGCFDAGQRILEFVSGGVIGLGIVVGLVLFAGIVPAALLALGLYTAKPLIPQQASSSRAYYTPSAGYDDRNGSYDNPIPSIA